MVIESVLVTTTTNDHDPEPGDGPGGMGELALVLERLVGVVRRLPAPGGLSFPTAATLNSLARSGPGRLCDLAAAENVTQPGMTQLVSRLERDGLARRVADATDRRAVLVSITEEGERLVDARRAARTRQLAGLVDGLEAAEQNALLAALPALSRLVERAEPSQRRPVREPAAPPRPSPEPGLRTEPGPERAPDPQHDPEADSGPVRSTR